MARTATGMKGGRRKSAVRESKGWGNNVNESRSKGCGIKAGRTRETETRGGKDSRNIDRGGGEWDCSLCLVVTVRPYIHSSMRLIGQRKVMWVEGEGGAWRLTENNRRGSKKKKKACVWGRRAMGCNRGRPGKQAGCWHHTVIPIERGGWLWQLTLCRILHQQNGCCSMSLEEECPDLPQCHLAVAEG